MFLASVSGLCGFLKDWLVKAIGKPSNRTLSQGSGGNLAVAAHIEIELLVVAIEPH
jgi:hypothetical protein